MRLLENNFMDAVEDTTGVVATEEDQIYSALDRALKNARAKAKTGRLSRANVLLVGDAGTGKTSRVKQWAADRGINLVPLDAKLLDEYDLSGAVRAEDETQTTKRYATTELDKLSQPNSVLFLDELNRARTNIQGTLLGLIADHSLKDPRDDDGNEIYGGERHFKNLLFSIAAINPNSGNYDVYNLDPAVKSRFREIDVKLDPVALNRYLQKEWTKEIKDEQASSDPDPERIVQIHGWKAIAQNLLDNHNSELLKLSKPIELTFDGPDEITEAGATGAQILNPRSLQACIEDSDGTVEDFLSLWNDYCNPTKKDVAKLLLIKYPEVDDKANQALDKYKSKFSDGDSPFAEKKKGLADYLAASNPEIARALGM